MFTIESDNIPFWLPGLPPWSYAASTILEEQATEEVQPLAVSEAEVLLWPVTIWPMRAAAILEESWEAEA